MRRRVLSIQGGGVNGIFAAKLLALVEQDLELAGREPRIARYFDLISGTSTGGVIALGLALEIPASKIVTFYQEKSSHIFPRWKRSIAWKASRRPRLQPIYKSGPLIKELKAVFGEKRLGHAATRIVIPTFNQSTSSVHLFKTAHHKNFERDFKLFAWDIAAATSAAPFYFPPHKMANGASFLDGGVWANNPVLVAVTECIQYCGWNRNETSVLSISGVRDVIEESYWQRLTGLPSALLDSQVKGSIAGAKTLLGNVERPSKPHGSVIDFATNVPTGTFAMDDSRSVDDLLGKADGVFRSRSEQIIEAFFSKPADPFLPEHHLSD